MEEQTQEKKQYGYAILVDQEILKKRAEEEGMDKLVERVKESAEIAVRSVVEGTAKEEENGNEEA